MIYFKSDNIVSPLGFSTKETTDLVLVGETGIKEIFDKDLYPEPFPASMIDEEKLETEFIKVATRYSSTKKFTKLEKMLIISVDDALSATDVDITSKRTAIILSTTKGNIDLLGNVYDYDKDRVSLWKLGEVIASFFSNPNTPVVISNACISGVLAINTAAMLIDSQQYDDVVVTGGDIVSRFVVSGFMSFLSLSTKPCKPFDANRDGLSLGEAAATIIMGNKPGNISPSLVFAGGSSANDANHISGPSRTGEGSYIAIQKAMDEAKINAKMIDHISAHGTATPYNDEMESIAIDRHGMTHVPVNSIKGNLGHTLGAAGIVESAILLEEMKRNILIDTTGYIEHGVSKPIAVIKESAKKELVNCLKMASGFGGSNAAMIISKIVE